MNTTHEQNYKDQRDAGRSMGDDFGETVVSLDVLTRRPVLSVVPKKTAKPAAKVPKGHESYLKALESSGTKVSFTKISTSEVVTGVVKTSDSYTVSIQQTEGTRVLFKHDISEFFVLAPASEQVH